MQDITKLCADYLRKFTEEGYGIKLKASHAHELVAAYLGYKSRAALLADTKYPLSNLRIANIVVLHPTDSIDARREDLQGLPANLPDSYILTEGVYGGLVAEKLSSGKLFATYELLATNLADAYLQQRSMGRVYRRPVREGVNVAHEPDSVVLTVRRFYQFVQDDARAHEVNIVTSARLPRLACHVGYGNPEVSAQVEDLGVR